MAYDQYGNEIPDAALDLRKEIKSALREETDDLAAQYQGFPNAKAMREAQAKVQRETQKKFTKIQADVFKELGIDPRELGEEDWDAVKEAMVLYAKRRKAKKAVPKGKPGAASRKSESSRGGPDPDIVEAAKADKGGEMKDAIAMWARKNADFLRYR